MRSFIKDFIKKNGPISFSSFIEMAMYQNDTGYYIRQNPIGANADYITSPHITSLFGRIIAIWIFVQWEKLNKPKNICIVELGPGSGIMMYDILNTLKKFTEFYDSIQEVCMVEISPVLVKIQQENLAGHFGKICWYKNFCDIPKKTMFLVANEFFDALPVDQFMFFYGRWFENKITEDFTVKEFETNFSLDGNFEPGDIVERCNFGKKISQKISENLKHYGGSALIIDYGYTENRYKNTVQAVKNHQYCDIFSYIGEADITHEVDFSYLFPKWNVISQKDFLLNHGLKERVEMISQKLNSTERKNLLKAAERLVSPKYMGEMFKVCYT